jgi:hypothetical protein
MSGASLGEKGEGMEPFRIAVMIRGAERIVGALPPHPAALTRFAPKRGGPLPMGEGNSGTGFRNA